MISILEKRALFPVKAMRLNVLALSSRECTGFMNKLKLYFNDIYDVQLVEDLKFLKNNPWEPSTRLLILHRVSNARAINTSPQYLGEIRRRIKSYAESSQGNVIFLGPESKWFSENLIGGPDLRGSYSVESDDLDDTQVKLSLEKVTKVKLKESSSEAVGKFSGSRSIFPGMWMMFDSASNYAAFLDRIGTEKSVFEIKDLRDTIRLEFNSNRTFEAVNSNERPIKCVKFTDIPEEGSRSWPMDFKDYFSTIKEDKLSKLGHIVLYSQKTDSTQRFLQENPRFLSTLPHGAVHVADRQTDGKGRSGNGWISPAGCLHFSLLLDFKGYIRHMHMVQYLFALACVQAVKDVHTVRLGDTEKSVDLSRIPIFIKWPNDIYILRGINSGDYRNNWDKLVKIGGIIVNSDVSSASSVQRLIIGLGLNIYNNRPTSCLHNLLKDQDLSPSVVEKLSPSYFLAKILNRFSTMYPEFERTGFKAFLNDYYANWIHTDQLVNIESNAELQEGNLSDQSADKSKNYEICGINDFGHLVAKSLLYPSQYLELQPDGNRFDMTKQMIFKHSSRI